MKIPVELTELGLVLFVYSVGLHAGPRFFSILRARGAAFLLVGVGATLSGALCALVVARAFGLSAELTGGLYCGATTCTPALAAVMDAVRRATPEQVSSSSVGYGVAYPFSLISVVLVIHAMPRLLRRKPAEEAARYSAEEATKSPPLEKCAFRVTNSNCAGRSIAELQSLHVSMSVICRVKHEGVVGPARPETILHRNDVVLAVGTPEELAKLEAVLGGVAADSMQDASGRVTSQLIVVSRRESIGKTLRQLEAWRRFGVVATRIRRDGVEFTPRGGLALEPGDVLRVVGRPADVDAFAALVGREERRLDETSLIPFAGGLALGAAVGQIPLPLPGGLDTPLGMGGGAFLVGLVLGRLGHVGPMRMYVPNAAKHLMRELGLVIFLAGAGCGAGSRLVAVLLEVGPTLLLAGAMITIVTIGTALLLLHFVLRWNLLSSAGALSACMTNPPGLATASQLAESDAAAVSFASVYPVGLISKIIFAQLIYLVLRM